MGGVVILKGVTILRQGSLFYVWRGHNIMIGSHNIMTGESIFYKKNMIGGHNIMTGGGVIILWGVTLQRYTGMNLKVNYSL